MYDTVIIIPYRDRDTQLKEFINKVAPLLLKYMDNIHIVFVEQYGDSLFNRGKLINVGCHYYKNKTNTFIIHDIDIIPTINTIKDYYAPPLNNIHVKGLFNIPKTLGGIYRIQHDVYFKCNGHSNDFWGWGCEDKDFKNRVQYHNFNIIYTRFRDQVKNNNMYFKILEDNKDEKSYKRIKSGASHMKDILCYKRFQILDDESKKEVMKSGVNNVKYKIYGCKKVSENITILTCII